MSELGSDDLTVNSHVGRDLEQTSALFKTDKAVVWEYVSNGLDYVDEGTVPTVYVHIDPEEKTITITDNGRGMDWEGLKNFFTMHGENLDRKAGRGKRGLFGTGKSAAFGIAEKLRIETVRDGKRSEVELTKSDFRRVKSVDPVPVKVIEQEQPTEDANGTIVEISGIRLRRIDQNGIIRYIQQHLVEMPPSAKVFVNNHELEYREPTAVGIRTFEPDERQRPLLGDVRLFIKVAGAPLEEVERGVMIRSKGVVYERTLAGLEGKEQTQYLFGELDVPRLDREAETAEVSPFDMSRSMTLNIENPLVVEIYSFVGRNLEIVRKELVERERENRASEESRKLEREAKAIARAINDDFTEYRQKVASIAAKARGRVDRQKLDKAETPGQLISGLDVRASETDEIGAPGSEGGSGGSGNEPRNLAKHLKEDSEGDRKASQATPGKSGKSSRGGFQVKFENMGAEEARAKYVRDERTIYVNLAHPQLLAAKGSAKEDQKLFRQLSYEIAFTEYAIALASELEREGEYIEISDSIVDIRSTINRLARTAAGLFG